MGVSLLATFKICSKFVGAGGYVTHPYKWGSFVGTVTVSPNPKNVFSGVSRLLQ